MCVLLSLFWPTFQSLIYELVDEDGCSSSFDISTRITQCAGFSSIRMYDDHDEVSHWVKSEESEDCKHVFFWFFLARRSWYILKVSEPVSCILGTGKKYRYRYRQNLVPEKSIGIGIVKIWYRKKVSVSVSKISGTGKKYRYRYRSKLWVPSHSGDYEHCVLNITTFLCNNDLLIFFTNHFWWERVNVEYKIITDNYLSNFIWKFEFWSMKNWSYLWIHSLYFESLGTLSSRKKTEILPTWEKFPHFTDFF